MNSKIQLRMPGGHFFGRPLPSVKIYATQISISHICFKERPHLVVTQQENATLSPHKIQDWEITGFGIEELHIYRLIRDDTYVLLK